MSWGVLVLLACIRLASAAPQGIREPVWAGQFYPAQAAELSSTIDHFLDKARPPSEQGRIRALIVPHAGYVYSGQTAAHAYRQVQGKNIKTVIILAPSHRHGFIGASIYQVGGYRTPLGIAAIDETTAERLCSLTGYSYVPEAHEREHAVEVQVPFIQKALPGARIIPVVIGQPDKDTIQNLSRALAGLLKEDGILVLASTDLSHFHPKTQANAVDQKTISLISTFQIDRIIDQLQSEGNIMCGGAGVAAVLSAAKAFPNPRIKILEYSDSSRAGGDTLQVVGYLAATILTDSVENERPLSEGEKRTLLELARRTLRLYLVNGKIPEDFPVSNTLKEQRGVFVTLRKAGALRGCIGFIETAQPLYEAVKETAVLAAVRDGRFPPVTPDELDDLDIEISVLSPLKKIGDPQLIQVGRHGLFISSGSRSGILLPQVAVENGWSRRTFLEQVCRKAGLPLDAWKTGAELFIFEAAVFH
ncbi:MAG: AmmeMemoRadiSam system protein B [Candidatus Aminicenantes bacterium]|nr:AmmeMemoRadiSam system protein B [Candidatus Aminicenantes bacterium]